MHFFSYKTLLAGGYVEGMSVGWVAISMSNDASIYRTGAKAILERQRGRQGGITGRLGEAKPFSTYGPTYG